MSGLGAVGQGQAQGSERPPNVSSLREELPVVEGGVNEGEGDGKDDELSSVKTSEDDEEGQMFWPAEEQPFTGSQAAQTVTAADGGVATSKVKKRYTDEEWAVVRKEKRRKANERRRARLGRVRAEKKMERAKKWEEEKERKEKEAARAQLWASAPKGPRQDQLSRPHQPRGGLSSSHGRGGFTPSQPMRGNAGGYSYPPARSTSGNLPWSPYQSRRSSQMGGLLAEVRGLRRQTARLEAELRDNRLNEQIEPVAPVKTEPPWDSRAGR